MKAAHKVHRRRHAACAGWQTEVDSGISRIRTWVLRGAGVVQKRYEVAVFHQENICRTIVVGKSSGNAERRGIDSVGTFDVDRGCEPGAPAFAQVNVQTRSAARIGSRGSGRDVHDAIVIEISHNDINRIAATRGVPVDGIDHLECAVSVAVSHGNAVTRSTTSAESEIKICTPVAVKIGAVQGGVAGRLQREKRRSESTSGIGEEVIGFLTYDATGVASG